MQKLIMSESYKIKRAIINNKMKNNTKIIKEFLKENAEDDLKIFNARLIYTSLYIYGIRTQKLRKFADELVKCNIKPDDIESSSHEEILLKGLVLAKQKWNDLQVIEEFEKFNDHIDNWATCDMITSSLKTLKTKNGRAYFLSLLKNHSPYKVRIGIIGLMSFFLDDENLDEIIDALVELSKTLSSKSTYSMQGTTQEKIENLGEYYIKMALSWYLCTLICKDYNQGTRALEKFQDKFVRNKAISKCHDSFKLTPIQKETLKKFKV